MCIFLCNKKTGAAGQVPLHRAPQNLKNFVGDNRRGGTEWRRGGCPAQSAGTPGIFGFRHTAEGRYPVRTNVSTCVADSKFLSRATRVPNPLRGKFLHTQKLGPAPESPKKYFRIFRGPMPRDDDNLEFFYNIKLSGIKKTRVRGPVFWGMSITYFPARMHYWTELKTAARNASSNSLSNRRPFAQSPAQ